jgi:hypothetical protein
VTKKPRPTRAISRKEWRLCGAVPHVLDYGVAEYHVEVSIGERQWRARLDSTVLKARVQTGQMRSILGPDGDGVLRIGVQSLEEVRFWERAVTGHAHIEHRGVWAGVEQIDEQLEYPAPRPERQTGRQGNATGVLVVHGTGGADPHDAVVVTNGRHHHRPWRVIDSINAIYQIEPPNRTSSE